MTKIAIVDTGFAYALLDADDKHHVKSWQLLRDPTWKFRVPTEILVEVFHNRVGDAISGEGVTKDHRRFVIQTFAKDLRWLTGKSVLFELEEMAPSGYTRIAELLDLYAEIGIDYVDAVVIVTAERLQTKYIMTTDQRDFRQYRPRFAEHFILPIFDA